ncbi:aromatic amino acid transport family protein [Desulfoplanes sp. PS50]
MSKQSTLVVVLTISFLVVGNLIGVGILALPINTGLAGLGPAMIGMIVLGGAMFFSALVLGKEAVASKKENFNLPSLYQQYLGAAGKWVAIFANMLILYGLLVAYLTGGAAILANLFHIPTEYNWLLTLIFFTIITWVALMNTGLILKYNTLIMLCLLVFFFLMVFMGETRVQVSHYTFADWKFLPATAPIIVTAFHFHNIIPTISTSLNWNFSLLWKTMLLGMIMGFVMNALWIQTALGVLPLDDSANSLLASFQNNLPATVPMAKILGTPLFMIASLIFSLLAIMTSYLANSMGLMGFVRDMTENQLGITNRMVVILLTFIPPLAIALIWPEVFLQALNIVGGVGIVILFGILPSIIFLKKSTTSGKKILGVIMLLLFLGCLACEIGQEIGIMRIRPEMEHWAPQIHHLKHG